MSAWHPYYEYIKNSHCPGVHVLCKFLFILENRPDHSHGMYEYYGKLFYKSQKPGKYYIPWSTYFPECKFENGYMQEFYGFKGLKIRNKDYYTL